MPYFEGKKNMIFRTKPAVRKFDAEEEQGKMPAPLQRYFFQLRSRMNSEFAVNDLAG
jgi:hypothetical protein